MTDIPLTLIGNITKTPARQYLRGNKAILRMTVASTPRYYSKAEQGYVDGEITYMPAEVRSTGSEKITLYRRAHRPVPAGRPCDCRRYPGEPV